MPNYCKDRVVNTVIVKHIDRKDKEKEQLSVRIAGVNILDYFQLYRKFTFLDR